MGVDVRRMVLQNFGGYLSLVENRPKSPPQDCGFSNEELECLGCGEKLGCIKGGHCYAVEGKDALKTK